METLFFDELDSTQTFLVENIKKGSLKAPVAVVAKTQTRGIGSRGNSWDSFEDSLYLSFALKTEDLPSDLPLPSISIYIGVLLIKILKAYNSKTFLKWPNDIYLDDKKAGGIITSKFDHTIVCGIGLNRASVSTQYGVLDINTPNIQLIDRLFFELEKKESWKQVFSYYEVEFYKSKKYLFSMFNSKTSLENAVLHDDGSVSVDGKKYYSQR